MITIAEAIANKKRVDADMARLDSLDPEIRELVYEFDTLPVFMMIDSGYTDPFMIRVILEDWSANLPLTRCR